MTRGAAPNTTRPRDAESRLIDALTSVCARDGYANATVERVLAAAGVSRASFYYHFSSIEDCFLSAYRVHSSALLDDVASAPATCSRGELAAIDALVGLAARRPDAALLLFREVLAAGEPGLSERRALIAAIERASGVLPPVSAVDLPSGVLLGGVSRFLAMRLTSAPVTEALADELHVWAAALTRPTRSRTPDRLEPSGTSHSDAPAPGPAPVAATLPVASAGSTRERLLLATAATVAVSGYRAATVADIVAAAGVSRRVFYRHFDSRRDAFAAAYEYAFARAMAAGAPAYFGRGSWPQRVWEGALAFTRFFASEPTFARIGFVECYALGPEFLGRVYDTQLAFTLFLEEGYRQCPQAESLPRVCSALTATTIFEVGYRAYRDGAGLKLRAAQPLVVYIALAPFLGMDRAGQFVAGKLGHRPSAAPTCDPSGTERV